MRSRERKERSQGHGGQRLRTAAEKAGARSNGNGHAVDWYGGDGRLLAFHGLSRTQREMKNAYLHQKAMFTICDCGLILRADTRRELTTERRRHERVCICVHRADDWSVQKLAA